MKEMNRREFVGSAAIVAGMLATGGEAGATRGPKKLTDSVKLGRTGIRSTLLGIGTGTSGWNGQSNQTRMGHDRFNAMIQHAYDRGVRFFDCADTYGTMPYLREAIRKLPRERFVIETKMIHRTAEEAKADLDRFRVELGVDMIDIVLLHVVTEADWNVRYRGVMDVLEEARQKKVIRAHGCSCHTLEALETAALEPWVQVDLARFNPWGRMMDNRPGEPETRALECVKPVLQKMRAAGKGVIAMKILGEGTMMRSDDRLARARESIRFAVSSGSADMMVIGFESPEQIDEVLREGEAALAEIAQKA